jgi:hypothetical protein
VRLRGELIFIAIAAIIVLMPACARKLKPQESCNFVQNSQQQRLSWKGHLPIPLYVHSSVPGEYYDALDRAVAEYNTKLGEGKEIFKIVARGVAGPLDPQRDGYSTIYWFNTWEADRPQEQARTTIFWSGTEIFEADIRINASKISYYSGADTNISGVDFDSLLVHELGHVLGLAHNVTTGSVMNIELASNYDRRKVGPVDMSSLKCEY